MIERFARHTAVDGGTRGLRNCWEGDGGDRMDVGGILILLTPTGPSNMDAKTDGTLAGIAQRDGQCGFATAKEL